VSSRFGAWNPAFDVTPAELITAIVTEHGVHRTPFAESTRRGGAGVKAVILAAGYATRLYPLTLDRPKALLSVGGGRCWSGCWSGSARSRVGRVFVVTNAKFAEAFREWARGAGAAAEIVDDGTRDEETRLGAIGDLDLTIREGGIDDDLLVLAGDNLFSESWRGSGFRAGEGRSRARCVRRGRLRRDPELCGDRARRATTVSSGWRRSRRTAHHAGRDRLYFYPRAALGLVREYLDAGNNPDQPGRLVEWLYRARPCTAGGCPVAGTTSARRRPSPRPIAHSLAGIVRHTSVTEASPTRDTSRPTLAKKEVSVGVT
jgi:glucose-1-phosphate thymidylyltransferase